MEEPGMAVSESAESKARVLTSIRLMVRLSEQYLRSQRKREETLSQHSGCAAEWTGDDSYFLRGGGAAAAAASSSSQQSSFPVFARSKPCKRLRSEEPNGCQTMNILPDEILLAIFASVHSARDRSSCASVCKRWLMLLTQMHSSDFTSWQQQSLSDEEHDDSVNQPSPGDDEHEILKLEKQPLWAMGDLSRCLENNRATDLRLASIAIGTAARGGLLKLTIRGGGDSVSDAGLSAIGNCCNALRSLTLWDCSRIGNPGLKSIAHGCRLLESLELLKCPRVSNSGLRAIARSCLRLSSLSLESCDGVGDEGISYLAESCSNLLTLSLSRCQGVGDASIISVVKNCPTLKKLKLERVGVSDHCLEFLSQNCKSITKLVLSGLESITATGFAALASPETLKFLKVLVLSGCPGVTDAFLSNFGSVCHDLYRLSLVDCDGVSDKGLDAFVSGYRSLKAFQIEKCGSVTYSGLASILKSANLKSLHISRCPGVQDSALNLEQPPLFSSTLFTKSFSMTYSGGVGDRCLELAGKIFPSIQHLDLSGTSELTDAGVKSFLSNSGGSLLSLNLSECCEVSDEGIVAVGSKCWELQTVVLEGCYRVSDKSVGFLASQCRGLQELDVSRCSISDDGIIAVVVSVGPALKTLSVAGCERITDESLPTIQKMCDSLTALNLKNCRLTAGAVEKFESELGNRCDIVLP